MKDLNRKFAPCVLDQKCLAKNIVYFSFLVPLQHQVVYNFVIGCATGQSCFVALERRCKCLVWASIPFDTILSSYCLFEVLVDRSQGGTFIGCQNVLDQLFRAIRFSNQFNLNRMPYIMEKSTDKERKVGFISTLKQLFRVSTFSKLATSDIDRVRHLEIEKLRDAVKINNASLPRWAEQIYNAKNVRHRCLKIQIISSELVVAKAVELTYARRTVVKKEFVSSQSDVDSDVSPGPKSGGFHDNSEEQANQIRINVDVSQDSTKRAEPSWKPSSSTASEKVANLSFYNTITVSNNEDDNKKKLVLFTKVLDNDSALMIDTRSGESSYLTPKTEVQPQTKLDESDLELQNPSLYSEVMRLEIDSKIKMMDSEICYNSARAEVHKDDDANEKDDKKQANEIAFDPMKLYDEESFERQFSWNKKLSSIRNVHSDNKYKEIEEVIRKSPKTMMDIAADLHQCGLVTGSRITDHLDFGENSKHSDRKLNESHTLQTREYTKTKSSKTDPSKNYPVSKHSDRKITTRNRTKENIFNPIQEGNLLISRAMPQARNEPQGRPGDKSQLSSNEEDSTSTRRSDSAKENDQSLVCSTTSDTERLLSYKMITGLERIEARDQLWTPLPPGGIRDLISNANNQSQCDERMLNSQWLDWECRLNRAMENYLTQQIF